MSRSSGLSPASAVAITGSSVMPQMGQLPGPIWRTWGCIGQVYSAPRTIAPGPDASSARLMAPDGVVAMSLGSTKGREESRCRGRIGSPGVTERLLRVALLGKREPHVHEHEPGEHRE